MRFGSLAALVLALAAWTAGCGKSAPGPVPAEPPATAPAPEGAPSRAPGPADTGGAETPGLETVTVVVEGMT